MDDQSIDEEPLLNVKHRSKFQPKDIHANSDLTVEEVESGQNNTQDEAEVQTEQLLPNAETTTLAPDDGLDDSEVPELPTPLSETVDVSTTQVTDVPSTESSPATELSTESSPNTNSIKFSTESSPVTPETSTIAVDDSIHEEVLIESNAETTQQVEETTTPIVLLAGVNKENEPEAATNASVNDEGEVLPTDPNNIEASGQDESKLYPYN